LAKLLVILAINLSLAMHETVNLTGHFSSNINLLAVLRFRLNTYGRRAFSVACPMAWNSLPDFIRDPTSSTDSFKVKRFESFK